MSATDDFDLVLAHYNIEQGRGKLHYCPFHSDREGGKPNMSVDGSKGVFYCYRCNAGGNLTKFVGMMEYGTGYDWKIHRDSVREKMAAILGRQIATRPRSSKPATKKVRTPTIPGIVQDAFTRASLHYAVLLRNSDDPEVQEAREYLMGRGLSLDFIRERRIGYCPSSQLTLAEKLSFGQNKKVKASVMQMLKSAFLVMDSRSGDGQWEWFNGRITFPEYVGVSAVAIVGRQFRSKDPKYLANKEYPKSLMSLGRIPDGSPVLLTESIMDMANLAQRGIPTCAVNGTGFPDWWVLALRKKKPSRIAIVPQNDEAGRSAADRWATLIPEAKALTKILPDKFKDFTEVFEIEGEEALTRIIEQLKKGGIHE